MLKNFFVLHDLDFPNKISLESGGQTWVGGVCARSGEICRATHDYTIPPKSQLSLSVKGWRMCRRNTSARCSCENFCQLPNRRTFQVFGWGGCVSVQIVISWFTPLVCSDQNAVLSSETGMIVKPEDSLPKIPCLSIIFAQIRLQELQLISQQIDMNILHPRFTEYKRNVPNLTPTLQCQTFNNSVRPENPSCQTSKNAEGPLCNQNCCCPSNSVFSAAFSFFFFFFCLRSFSFLLKQKSLTQRFESCYFLIVKIRKLILHH